MRRGRRRGQLRHPSHEKFRDFCRVFGPALVVAGVVMMVIAGVDFFGSFGDFDDKPTLFWLFFLAVPCLGIGSILIKVGFLGAAARYVAGETAPVATDTINYVARGTKESVKEAYTQRFVFGSRSTPRRRRNITARP